MKKRDSERIQDYRPCVIDPDCTIWDYVNRTCPQGGCLRLRRHLDGSIGSVKGKKDREDAGEILQKLFHGDMGSD